MSMIKGFFQGVSKLRVCSVPVNNTYLASRSSFLNNTTATLKIQTPIEYEQQEELDCVMNKTSRKVLKKHRKKNEGKKSNMRKN
ncbi:hypothetical protein CYY_000472 [Polysphondylium violaceum]|uniref:Uncharacterized protein n=1 Tax=Polysphondylium violaceum TaxID=133409 RepID=A0A8J4V8V7_9MYCE|nr:hypothetical protein CYY_000472 [Polysphondylium violaceum]